MNQSLPWIYNARPTTMPNLTPNINTLSGITLSLKCSPQWSQLQCNLPNKFNDRDLLNTHTSYAKRTLFSRVNEPLTCDTTFVYLPMVNLLMVHMYFGHRTNTQPLRTHNCALPFYFTSRL